MTAMNLGGANRAWARFGTGHQPRLNNVLSALAGTPYTGAFRRTRAAPLFHSEIDCASRIRSIQTAAAIKYAAMTLPAPL